MITTYTNKEYRITYDGVSMVENALGQPNLVQISVVTGCTIIVAQHTDYGINYIPNGDYPSWNLTGENTRINRKEANYIYAKLSRDGNNAFIAFSVNDYEIDGRIVGDTSSQPNENYYYIKIGSITGTDAVGASATINREISYDGGYLTTPQANNENTTGWKDLFVLTADNLINALKRFASFTVQGTLSIIGKFVLNGNEIDNVVKSVDDSPVISDKTIPTSGYLHGPLKEYFEDIFLSSVEEDTAKEIITFLKGILLGNFQSGVLGSGGCFSIDPETGESYIEADRMLIRKVATFIELIIQRLKHIGGQFVVSPASLVISEVKEHAIEQVTDENGNVIEIDNGIPEGVYRCYFETTDGKTKIYNEFEVEDLARCQTFNIKEGINQNAKNTYWWRLVTDVGEDYIDISKTNCDKGSEIPAVGDNVCQFGNLTDTSRQNAIIISSYGNDAPSFKIYNGINSYFLEGKEVASFHFDKATGRMRMRVYGDAYIGAKDKSSYIEFDIENGLVVKGKFYNESGEELGDVVKNLGVDVKALKNQNDKQYILWFGTEIPTLLNYPAEDWEESEYESHTEDLFYLDNDADEENNGRAWRFKLHPDGVTYGWNEVTDKYVLQAIKIASEAKKEAQSKKRIFISQPTDDLEYDVGDMWTNAYYKNADGSYLYEDDTLVCKVAKEKGTPFSISHWKPASFGTKANIINTGEAIRTEVQASINAVNDSLASLEITVNSIEASVQNIHFDEAGNIENISINGLVANADFSALVSQIIDADGNVVKSAQISTFVTMDDVNEAISNIELSADQINFIGKTIINGNFVVDEQGNLTLKNLDAVSGTIGGLEIASNGLETGGTATWLQLGNKSLLSSNRLRVQNHYSYAGANVSMNGVYLGDNTDLFNDSGQDNSCVAFFYRQGVGSIGSDRFKPAVIVESANSAVGDTALELRGSLRLKKGGIMGGGYYFNLDAESGNLFEFWKGTSMVVYTGTKNKHFFLPGYNTVLNYLGLSADKPFCFPIDVAAHPSSADVVLDMGGDSDRGYLLDWGGNEIFGTTYTMACGDSLRLLCTYDPGGTGKNRFFYLIVGRLY